MVDSLKALKPNIENFPDAAKRKICVLGSTGSVGTQTLELVAANPHNYVVDALTANRNVDLLVKQAKELNAAFAVVADASCYAALKSGLSGTQTEVAAGPEAVLEAAKRNSDWVMAAIVGAAGLGPTLEAVRRGATVAFANKECLVCAGPLMMQEVAQHKAQLLPVDSEHNAIYQVFDAERRDGIERLILTASGGPFRQLTLEQMKSVTAEQAVKHPVWAMGAKISIDSATMMNKGLELIEAHFLFDMPEEKIAIHVHPQSVIHSMVEYKDGSVLAQLGTPDMRTPIAHTLAYPNRMATPAPRLDLTKISALTFEEPDPVRFASLRLAREALRKGGTAPTILNAANEIAVAAFLNKRIGFLDIAQIVEETLEQSIITPISNLDIVAISDTTARRMAEDNVRKLEN